MLLSAIKVSKQQYYSRISKNWWILVQNPRLIGHFCKRFWSIRKYLAFLYYFIIINFFRNFRDKAELFNNFFAQQRTLIDNASEIPATRNIKSTKTLSSIPVTRADIDKVIKSLDPKKAHGHDMISIRVLKLCGDSVLPSLELIFKSCLESQYSSGAKKIIAPYHYSIFA